MIEDVLTKMKETMQLHMTTELQKQDGKYSDGIILEDFAQIRIGDETIDERGLPVAILQAQGASYEEFLTTKTDVIHDLTIGVVVTDTDEDISQKRLYRTIRALQNCFEINLDTPEFRLKYNSVGVEYNVPLNEISDSRSTEKAGVLTCTVRERVDAFTANQL